MIAKVHARWLATLVAALFAVPSTHAGEWPQFRGPTGMGQSDERGLPTKWDAKGTNVAWKTELPAGTNPYSSPVVVGERIFVTVSQDKEPRSHQVICLNAADGAIFWKTEVPAGPWKQARNTGYPTPVADATGVCVVFGTAVVARLDLEGKIVWRKELEKYSFDVAMGSSPVPVGDTIVLLCDQTGKSLNLLAFDKQAGDIRWEAERPEMNFAHSTPVLAKVNGAEQLIAMVSKGLQGIDPASGKVLWTSAGDGDTSSPVIAGSVVYADGGRGGPGIGVDVSSAPAAAPGDKPAKLEAKWKTERLTESLCSPIVVGEQLYRLQKDTLVCLKLATGEPVYTGKLPAVSSWASPIATADGLLYFASGGKSYVVRAGPALEIVSVNDLADANHASAAVAGGRLFIRGAKHMWCIKGP